jgi:hypothetical protein
MSATLLVYQNIVPHKTCYMLKKFNPVLVALLLTFLTVFSGCEVIGGIFKAGVWSGIIIVVLVVVLIIWLVGKMGRK